MIIIENTKTGVKKFTENTFLDAILNFEISLNTKILFVDDENSYDVSNWFNKKYKEYYTHGYGLKKFIYNSGANSSLIYQTFKILQTYSLSMFNKTILNKKLLSCIDQSNKENVNDNIDVKTYDKEISDIINDMNENKNSVPTTNNKECFHKMVID